MTSYTTVVRFVDTNILVYAGSSEAEDSAKQVTASALLEADDLALSVQVLQEFYVQATRRNRRLPMRHTDALAVVESMLRFPVEDLTPSLVLQAVAAAERWNISYWDAAIVEAARIAGCDTLLTEDLQDGMDFDGVRVVNPFASSP